MNGGWDQATWKRVESEDELRAGMTVQNRPCYECGVICVKVITAPARPGWCEDHPDGCPRAWMVACRCSNDDGFCFGGPSGSIAKGTLYRLVDTTPAEEMTTTTRELEKVTG